MSKYVVAFINFFDNELKQMVIDAMPEKDAAIEAFDGGETLKQAKITAFDADEMFSTTQIGTEEVVYEFVYHNDGFILSHRFKSDKEAQAFILTERPQLKKYTRLV